MTIESADLQPIEIFVRPWHWWRHTSNRKTPILPSLTDCLSGDTTTIKSGRDNRNDGDFTLSSSMEEIFTGGSKPAFTFKYLFSKCHHTKRILYEPVLCLNVAGSPKCCTSIIGVVLVKLSSTQLQVYQYLQCQDDRYHMLTSTKLDDNWYLHIIGHIYRGFVLPAMYLAVWR